MALGMNYKISIIICKHMQYTSYLFVYMGTYINLIYVYIIIENVCTY